MAPSALARVERFLPWIAAAVLAAGIAVFFLARGDEAERTHQVPLPASALEIVRRFIHTAVQRRGTGTSYDLVTPRLRRGYTRAEWARGDIPVVPYPAKRVRVVPERVRYSYPNSALLEVRLFGAPLRPETFRIGLARIGGRWLVRSWQGVSRVPPPEASAP